MTKPAKPTLQITKGLLSNEVWIATDPSGQYYPIARPFAKFPNYSDEGLEALRLFKKGALAEGYVIEEFD